jgi:endonuclease YncB( thermonuclease family)
VLGTVVAGTLGVLAAAGLVMMGLSTDLFGRAPPGPDRFTAEPNQVAVIGGDTLRLEGQVIRLRGVEAPDRGDRCRGELDCGGAATSALAGLVRDRRVECHLTGRDAAGRPFAACEANGTDLSRAIVASGWARAQPGAPELADLELRARRQGAGLWAEASAR